MLVHLAITSCVHFDFCVPSKFHPSRSKFKANSTGMNTKRPREEATDSSTVKNMWDDLSYLPGFGNHFSSEALPNALPATQNNPQKCPYNTYCEQLSGTAFTAPRNHNQRTYVDGVDLSSSPIIYRSM